MNMDIETLKTLDTSYGDEAIFETEQNRRLYNPLKVLHSSPHIKNHASVS